jgi:hypothetical protein
MSSECPLYQRQSTCLAGGVCALLLSGRVRGFGLAISSIGYAGHIRLQELKHLPKSGKAAFDSCAHALHLAAPRRAWGLAPQPQQVAAITVRINAVDSNPQTLHYTCTLNAGQV